MSRRCARIPHFGYLVTAGLLLSASPAWTDEPKKSESNKWRRYREGPLVEADFRGEVPANRIPLSGGGSSPLTAFTYTELRYESRFQVTGLRDRWTAKLISAQAFAIVRQDLSWNLSPRDQRLLDHEQGHFDLTHSYALTMQLYLDDCLKSRRLPVGTGESSAEAIRNLENKLKAELKPIFDEHTKAQADYDRITHHGTIRDAQGEQRKLHLAKIAELSDKLAVGKKKK